MMGPSQCSLHNRIPPLCNSVDCDVLLVSYWSLKTKKEEEKGSFHNSHFTLPNDLTQLTHMEIRCHMLVHYTACWTGTIDTMEMSINLWVKSLTKKAANMEWYFKISVWNTWSTINFLWRTHIVLCTSCTFNLAALHSRSVVGPWAQLMTFNNHEMVFLLTLTWPVKIKRCL